MGSYRILSIDGGGIRGLFAAVLLDRLSQRVPFFLDSVDLAAGTSTGGIIALGLALGLKPSDLVSLYKETLLLRVVNYGDIFFVGAPPSAPKTPLGLASGVTRISDAQYWQ